MNLRCLVVAGLLLLAAAPAGAQIEESCVYDEVAKQVTAVTSPGGEATLQVVDGEIRFGADPQPCGTATDTNTETIRIAGHAGTGERLVLDQRTGVFFPEIKIFAMLGDAADSVVLYLTEGDDRVAPGVNGIGLNADGEVDVVFVDADDNPIAATFLIEIHALGGNDYVNGRGQFGAGLAYLGPLTIYGGPGDEELIRGSWEDDLLIGGPGDDVIDGQDGDDVLDGGPGNDTLTAGGGNDVLIGGPGVDSLIGSTGDDVFYAIDLTADAEINGGPGMDTAYYDAEGLDPDPLFVENKIPGDTTPPDVSCESADGAWHAEDVAIACTAEDPESLLADSGDEAFELSTNVTVGSETADAATGTREVCNGAGLCSTAGPVTGNRIDKKAPANPTGVRSTDHTPGEWSRDREVSIVFDAASDEGSGVDGFSYSWTEVATSEADQSKDLEDTATGLTSPTLGDGRWYLHLATVDNVGNWSSSDHYGPYLIAGDTTPPDVSCESADGEWHADDVALPCTAADPESQIPNAEDEAFELSTNVPVGSETADAATGTREVCNGAGLCSTAGPVTGNRVDKKVPANPTRVESTDHTLGKWSRDREVSIVFDAASDEGSGVDGFSYSWTTVATSDGDQSKDLEETALGLTSPVLGNGRWYLHIATVDNVGNWSSSDHYGPYLIDGALPRVSVLPASVRVGKPIRLRYRTADNNQRTRERITLARGGSIVAAWTRPMAVAQWSAIQSVPWTPRRSGPYSYCVQAWDQAGNTRRACRVIR